MNYTCIIGGNGFIGKYLSSLLLQKGIKVKIIGRKPEKYPHPSVVYNYISDLSELPMDYFDDVEYVVHAAYIGTPKSSYIDPVKDINENLLFSVKLFERLRTSNVKKIAFISSGGAVYGQQLTEVISEDHPTNPISPYGITKLCIEKYAQLFHHNDNLPVVIIRPSNAYGFGQQFNTGQGFITAVLEAIQNDHLIEVYGENGTIRDYIHVSDVAKGIFACLEYGTTGQIYNLGTGMGFNNVQVIHKLSELFNKKDLRIKILPERPFDVKKNILNSGKLIGISNWQPEYNLETGLEELLKHIIEPVTKTFREV